jgi:N-acetylneuraminic acid mutarotase
MRNVSILLVILVIMTTCTKEEVTPRKYPRVDTKEVTNISGAGATFNGEIIFIPSQVTDHGFLWSPYSDVVFTNSDQVSLGAATGTGTFSSTIDYGLVSGKTYYVRAYAKSQDFSVYGDVMPFKSLGSKAPVLKSFYPEQATWGDTLVLVGQGFSNIAGEDIIKFNDKVALWIGARPDTLMVYVPFDLDDQESIISLTRSGNTSTQEQPFVLKSPEIESMSPSGTIGSHLVITGKYLRGLKTKVTFHEKVANIIGWGIGFVKISVPNNLPTGEIDVKVTTGTGSLFDNTTFQIVSPALTSISPSVGGETDQITIVGDFFSDEPAYNKVMFDDTEATVVSSAKNEMVVIVPPNVNSISPTITVTVAGTVAKPNLFSFHAPIIEGFTPSSGGYGSEIRIHGKYFRLNSYNQVFVGNKQLDYAHASSPTEIVGWLYGSSTKHLEKVRVTFQTQEAVSAQNFSIPWITFNNFTGPEYPPSVAAINGNSAYVGFAYNGFNDFWRYGSAANNWTKLADFPGAQRNEVVGFSAGGAGYFGGGHNSVLLRDLWEYNYSNNTWTQQANLPMTGYLATGFDYAGFGYIVERKPGLSDLWRYDHASDNWTMISTGPFETFDYACRFILDEKLYLQGGYDLWRYDFETDEWTDLGATPPALRFAIVISGTAYGLSHDMLYKYDHTTNTWSQESSPIQYMGAPNSAFAAGGKAIIYLNEEPMEFDPQY